ncbi:hypothetical protein [Brevibacterium otitidis]|uniref:Single-stranded DNA-binding protein n=1 Tax=Brevibacterium otitidis TaxID=53364 RepID=A0ABV5X597_9MICO|nr:hypothetical protein GCM10023233_22940 [Brevibacterium otitidis]
MTSIADMLAQTGGIFAKWPTIGTTYAGEITANPEVRQRRDIGTGEPLTWKDGNPQQEIIVTIKTEQRDPEKADDDGTRKVVIKAWGPQMNELKRAVQAAGATDLQVGGRFSMTYKADGQASNPGFNAPKLFEMRYEAPSATAGMFAGSQAAPQPASQWGQQPQAAQPQAPAPAQQQPAGDQASGPDSNVNKARQLIGLGLDTPTIAQATGLDQNVIEALRNA